MSCLNNSIIEKYYKAPGDYPEIQVQCTNICYAHLLLKDYASFNSEMTAITTYVQNHIVSTDKKYQLAIEAFRRVSMVEMEHLELLGETIKALGGFPKFATHSHGEDYFWHGSAVSCTSDMIQMLTEAIKAEYAAIEQYYAHIDAIDDYYVCRLLARIIEDEKCHIKLFKILLQEFK